MSDPKRLLDDPTMSAQLRQDLRAAKEDKVAYDVAAGLAALHVALDASVAVSSQAAAASVKAATTAKAASGAAGGAKLAGGGLAATKMAAGGAVAAKVTGGAAALTKVAVVLGVVTASAVGVNLLSSGANDPSADQAPPAPPAAVAPSVPAVARPTEPSTAPSAAGLEQATGSGELAAPPPVPAMLPHRDQPPLVRSRPTHGPRLSGAELSLRRETQQLARIKRLVDVRPASALALADAGHRRFVDGLFYPEREGLAVLALVELARDEEAVRRGKRWLARFADSPMGPRVRAALARIGAEEGAP